MSNNEIKHGMVQVRECPVCKKTLAVPFKVFETKEEFLRWLNDDTPEGGYPVYSIPCPDCDPPDAVRFATHVIAYLDGEILGEPTRLGTTEVPVAFDDPSNFAVTISEEEMHHLDKGDTLFGRFPPSTFDDFVQKYVEETLRLGRENEVWRNWDKRIWAQVFERLGLPQQETKNDYRRVARQHAKRILELYMREMIARVQYTTLRIFGERGYKDYDSWSVQYFILHVPLPEELEGVRTELIGKHLTHRNDYGSEALFRRIRELQGKLDDQRRKTQSVIDQLAEQRRKQAELERKLSEAYARIRELEQRLAETKMVALPAADRRKAEWKGLIAELRADVERLEEALREANRTVEITVPAVEEEQEAPRQEIDVTAVLASKTVAIIGGPHEHLPDGDYPCRVLYHRGERSEGLDHLLNVADVIVLVISFISHGTMWYVREEALERDKPVVFARQTNVDLLLQRAAEALARA